jgi:hypothetical protein
VADERKGAANKEI